MDDVQKLLERARSLEEEALATVFDQYYPLIYRYIFLHTGHTETAEDLSAQVFRRLLDAFCIGNGPDQDLKAWLFRVAVNLIVDEVRRGQHRDHLPLDEMLVEAPLALDDEIQQRLLAAELRSALGDLTDSQRSVIILRYLMELSNEETAQIMEMTVGAVKAQQHRALVALRHKLEDNSHEPYA